MTKILLKAKILKLELRDFFIFSQWFFLLLPCQFRDNLVFGLI